MRPVQPISKKKKYNVTKTHQPSALFSRSEVDIELKFFVTYEELLRVDDRIFMSSVTKLDWSFLKPNNTENGP